MELRKKVIHRAELTGDELAAAGLEEVLRRAPGLRDHCASTRLNVDDDGEVTLSIVFEGEEQVHDMKGE